ncbi:MAG: TRAP transporter small permease [Rhizobiaceae bacterium]|nr:TRAP transporter small permease [Rhizobiaceae bacterium]
MSLAAIMRELARGLAVSGGVVLTVLTILTVMSITGRALIWAGLSPVPGDFEMVEAGVAFAIFSFLPWCQFVRGHASVDIFTNFLSDGANRIIDLVTEILMTAFIVIVAWRLWYGMLDKIRYNETTFILQFPVWWAYAACMVAAAIGAVISLYLLYEQARATLAGRPLSSRNGGSVH